MENTIKNWSLIVGSLAVISLVLTIWMPFLSSLRIVFGSFYVLFLPGYILTYIFFPAKEQERLRLALKKNEEDGIDMIERIALSFALSIAIVPLVVFYLNLIGIKINFLNTFLTILAIILISLACIYKKNIFKIFKR